MHPEVSALTGSELQLAFSEDAPSAPGVWRRIENVLDAAGKLDGRFQIDEKPIPGPRIGEVLEKRSSRHFSITGAGFEFDYGPGKLSIKTDNRSKPADWDRWVAAFSVDASFVSAYLFDREYKRWQNTIDPALYMLHGRPHEHLPMKSNEKPPPINRMIIDTSRNPGRYILHRREDFVEAVGAVMWLGPLFAERTGADLDALKTADWCQVTQFAPGVLRVQVQETCFTSSEGREAELQDRLRAALFPKAVSKD